MGLGYQKIISQIEGLKSNGEKIALLDDHASKLCEKEKYDEAIRLYQKALEYKDEPNIQAYLSGQIGICYYLLDDNRHAEKYLLKASKWFNSKKPNFIKEMYALVNLYLSSLYEYQGKPQRSLYSRKECLKYINQLQKETQSVIYSGLGRNYEDLGKPKEAIKYCQKAIEVLNEDNPGLTYLYESIALNHYELGQYDEAIRYFNKTLELDPNFEHRNHIYFYIAECHHRLMNYKTALGIYLKLLELKIIANERNHLIRLLIAIMHCYYRLKEYGKSLATCQQALKERIDDKQELAEIRSYLTNNYYELQRYEEAVAEGKKTLEISKQFNNLQLMLRSMALSCYKLGDYKGFKKYKDWHERAFPEDNWNKYLNNLKPTP